MLRALRTQSTHPQITLVSNPTVLPLALAFGIAEEVSDYGHMQWSELFSTTGIHTQTMRDLLQGIDQAICWLGDPDGLVEHNLRMAGIKRVIVAPGHPVEGLGQGQAPQDAGRTQASSRPYAPLHVWTKQPSDAQGLHIVEYLAQTVGLQLHSQMDTSFILPACHDSLHLYNGYIAIHPGSGGADKCWPADYFARVIERLGQQGRSMLLLSGPADQERIQAILGDLRGASVKLLVNEPLLELAYQLQQCSCYLGNDSGITHLAALLGVPTVALFGPSDPTIWRPLGLSVTIIQEYPLSQLTIDVVMNALQKSCSR